ncbi:MAG: helix-turn-helix domain-containing protein [bacterium]|nr:helix-turn-helix domain-containing protein [bacterium]
MINQKSIAVLPLENLSSDPENEYFSSGMTEEIINALSKIEGLKVTSRTSSFVFKEVKRDVRHIGNELGVSLVLEGSVRKSGNNVRITTQLIRTDNGFHLWSENFDRKLDDIFALQDEISLLVADRIRENFGHIAIDDSLVKAPTENIKAYELFLRGRFFFFTWNLSDIKKAITFFKQSIELDPTFDQPYFGVSYCYSLLGSWKYMDKKTAFQEAELYLSKGSNLGKQSVIRYFAEAVYHFWANWNYKKAYTSLKKAHDLNSQDADPIDFIAELGRAIGDFNTGLIFNSKGLEVNPLSPNAFFTKSTLYYYQGQFAKALETIDHGLSVDPNFILLHDLKVLSLIQTGQKESLDQFLRNKNTDPLISRIAYALYSLLHENEIKKDNIEQIVSEIEETQYPFLYPWDLYLRLHNDQLEDAIEILKQKVKNREGQVVNFKNDPVLDPIKSLPEFQELVEQNFPDERLEHDLAPTNILLDESSDFLGKEEIEHYKNELIMYLEGDQAYLNTELTLRSLSEKIDLHPNKLSWLLNEKIGKNFNDFINSYRLKAFQQKAIDPKNNHLTLLGLAFESGFTSKSVFNDFFKKSTGSTPKAWVKQAKTS